MCSRTLSSGCAGRGEREIGFDIMFDLLEVSKVEVLVDACRPTFVAVVPPRKNTTSNAKGADQG